MNRIARHAAVLGAVLVLVVPSVSRANCVSPRKASNVDRPFYTFATYLDFDDLQDNQGQFIGRFWQTGARAAANEGDLAIRDWLFHLPSAVGVYTGYWYFNIDLGDEGVRGCPSGCLTVYLEDTDTDRFVLWTRDDGIRLVPANHFDFTDVLGGDFLHYDASDSPRPRVTGSHMENGDPYLDYSVTDPTPGVVTDTTCGGAVEEIRIYSKVARRTPEGDLSCATWRLVETLGSGGGTGSARQRCWLEEPNQYLASALVVGGEETGFLGEPEPVQCSFTENPLDWDGDGVMDVDDNCIDHWNPDQNDFDADTEGDRCDHDDGRILLYFDDPDWVEWVTETGFDSWNVHRGDLQVLKDTGAYTQAPGSNALALRTCGITGNWSGDCLRPEPGSAAFYLVSGTFGGSEGSLGTDSDGAERPNTDPCM